MSSANPMMTVRYASRQCTLGVVRFKTFCGLQTVPIMGTQDLLIVRIATTRTPDQVHDFVVRTWLVVTARDCCGEGDCALQGVLNTGPLTSGDYAFIIEGFISSHGRYEVTMGCETNHRENHVRGNLDCSQSAEGQLAPLESHLYNFSVGVNTQNIVFSSCGSSFDSCAQFALLCHACAYLVGIC